MKYIDAEKLIALIDAKLEDLGMSGSVWVGRSVLQELKNDIITSLQQEQSEVDLEKEAASEDLERASRKYADDEEYGDDVYFSIKAAFKAGARWQREQMIKDAIDTRIDKRLADMIGYAGSERVKVIIIKE